MVSTMFGAVALLLSLSAATSTDAPVCEKCQCSPNNAQPQSISCKDELLRLMPGEDEWPEPYDNTELEIDLEGNLLERVPPFPKLPAVSLTLEHNLIVNISAKAFINLENLKFLDLSRNHLTSEALVSEVFQGKFHAGEYLPLMVEKLDLSFNKLHRIDKDAFEHLPRVKELSISDNPIPILDHQTVIAITTLSKIRVLKMAFLGLVNLPAGFLHSLRHLEKLDLSGNEFSRVPSELRYAVNLRSLDIDRNPIIELNHKSFLGLKKLRNLSVSSMSELRSIGESTFAPLKSLKSLKCSYNRYLHYISGLAFNRISDNNEEWPVMELRLRSNNLSTLRHELAPWNMLTTIDLQDNPWKCDCHLKWMTQSLLHQIEATTPDLTISLLCNSPPKYHDETMYGLLDDEEAFTCSLKAGQTAPAALHPVVSNLLVVVMIATLMFIIISALLVAVYIYRKKTYRYYSSGRKIKYQRAGDEKDVDEGIVNI